MTANRDSTVSVLLGDGTGDFDPATTFAAGGFNYSVAVGNFNGDEFDDVAVGVNSYNPGIVSVLIADGTGGFNPATDFPTGNDPEDVAIGDFDDRQDFIQLKGPADVYSLDFFTSELGTIDADLIFDPGVSARGEVIATLQNVSTDLSVTDPSFIFV